MALEFFRFLNKQDLDKKVKKQVIKDIRIELKKARKTGNTDEIEHMFNGSMVGDKLHDAKNK